VDGRLTSATLTDDPFTSPSSVGRAGVFHAGLPDFSCSARMLQKRRGFAHPQISLKFCLHSRSGAGFVPASVKNKKQGWAGCEQRKLSPQLRCARALRPAAKQPVNRRFMARGPACLALSSSMETRFWGPSPGLRPTCFIARQVRANAADPLTGPALFHNKAPSGPSFHKQRAVAGLSARDGVLHLQNPNSKDTSCSKRS